MATDYTFDGLVSTNFPESRDANGGHLGTVQPGDIRPFDNPPDSLLWHETTDAERETARADSEPAPENAQDDAGEDTGAAEGDAPDPGPQDEDEPSAF